jgi:hypothetical protein
MGSYILRLEDKYLIWASVVDAPTTKAMTREELEKYYREEYGNSSMHEFELRMARVDQKGTSAYDDACAMNTMGCNRAGPGEATLSYQQIVDWWVHGVKPSLSVLQAKHENGSIIRVAAYCFEDAQRIYADECCSDSEELAWETAPGEWVNLNRGFIDFMAGL